MTSQDLEKFANKIVELENIIQNSDDTSEVEQAKEEMSKYATLIPFKSLADIDLLDDIIQEKLKKKFDL